MLGARWSRVVLISLVLGRIARSEGISLLLIHMRFSDASFIGMLEEYPCRLAFPWSTGGLPRRRRLPRLENDRTVAPLSADGNDGSV